MQQALFRAIEKSMVTCETCGGEGSLNEIGWKRVECKQCEKERQEDKRLRMAKRQKERDLELSRIDSATGLLR